MTGNSLVFNDINAFIKGGVDNDGRYIVQKMTITYRPAVPEHTAHCIAIRGKTRENAISVEQLVANGITLESWSQDIRCGKLCGLVCLADQVMVGYCFGDRLTGEIVVLALLPDWEASGIGKRLLLGVIDILQGDGFERLFLGCSSDPNCRSYGFYRHLGWRSTGKLDAAQDELLEYFPRGGPAASLPDTR